LGSRRPRRRRFGLKAAGGQPNGAPNAPAPKLPGRARSGAPRDPWGRRQVTGAWARGGPRPGRLATRAGRMRTDPGRVAAGRPASPGSGPRSRATAERAERAPRACAFSPRCRKTAARA